jgi:hypothetical protein
MKPTDLNFKWELDPTHNAFCFGESNNGGGVFKEEGKWSGNSVVAGQIILGFGPYENMLDAQKAVEKDFQERLKSV